MPLPSRYLRSSQQISRFPKLHGKGERTAADTPAMMAEATIALACPHGAVCTDHGGYEVVITPDGGPSDLATLHRDLVNERAAAALVWLALPVETVEFPVSYAAEKSMPLVRREPEDRPSGVPAIANADLAAGQARHLDAVAVRVTQRALDPEKT
jgi:hypothetical protein